MSNRKSEPCEGDEEDNDKPILATVIEAAVDLSVEVSTLILSVFFSE